MSQIEAKQLGAGDQLADKVDKTVSMCILQGKVKSLVQCLITEKLVVRSVLVVGTELFNISN